jgi:tripartite ATP-independent transporter DctP family solute receptor
MRATRFAGVVAAGLTLLAAGRSLKAEDQIVVKLATVAPEGSPWAQGLVDFKKMVETDTANRVKIKLFLGGKLGDENETVLACKRGQLQAVAASTGAIASQVPEVNILELPYLFNNSDEADHVLDTVATAKLEPMFRERGLVLSFWSENGFRSFGGKFPVTTLADLKGRKMRSQENPIHLGTYRAFGASPVPIPTTEALTALQTGVVDGFDQTPLYAFAATWHTAVTHFSISEHIYQPAAIIFNKDAYDAWPADVQAAMKKAGATLLPTLRKNIRALNPILLQNLAASGLKVNTLSADERKPFQAAAATMRAEYVKGASKGEKDLFKAIDDSLVAFRKKK